MRRHTGKEQNLHWLPSIDRWKRRSAGKGIETLNKLRMKGAE
jgi:hypothetical protein